LLLAIERRKRGGERLPGSEGSSQIEAAKEEETDE